MKTRWTRHAHGFGWICECGYHGRTQAGRDVHERRASRGLGCKTEKINPQAKEIEMTDEQKQMAYYKAGMLKKAPPFVPARVRVLKEQFGDGPFRGAGVSAGEHDCRCNKWGAVSVSARDGKLLGLRPDEFEPVAWRENAPPPETRNDRPCGD